MKHHDNDQQETIEWLSSIASVYRHKGQDRARYLLERLFEQAEELGVTVPTSITTPYRNTITKEKETPLPGDMQMERKIRAMIRWNAIAMVARANRRSPGIGGHISSFSSCATLYDIGFSYFFRGQTEQQLEDLIFYQGHSSPGMYARSYLEGRLTEEQLDNFRNEVDHKGLSSYPHPWLMPDYWQFPTVSMGLGPIQAIYQAHLMRYQSNRSLVNHGDRKLWVFIGDGECDEPETLGAISLAGREHLDNLIFVINCNLQRLDGPVRGNGKIIQELEGQFRGAGWNVIKVVWGRRWDELFAKDTSGLLQKRMDEAVDGEFQNYSTNGGAYTREHFFGQYPELLELVDDLSDREIMELNRGGHDVYKVYAAYHEAFHHTGQPTVILAHTVKGYGTGDAGEAHNKTHSLHELSLDELKSFKKRFNVPISDEQLEESPYYRPSEDSEEMRYMRKQREKLGGPLPSRRADFLPLPEVSATQFEKLYDDSGAREFSTTMAFVRILNTLMKDKNIGSRVVPIVPDEARTFGMEGMFRPFGIYSAVGQHYEPHDAQQIMPYKEDTKGQILQAGITEAGALSFWLAAATSYSVHHFPMVPFYIFYSMFGFQRVFDLIWAGGDAQTRGFLIGATSGRTTLNGEGLQHQDGHSHVMAGFVPNCLSYDPCYAYELAVIITQGYRRMYVERENVFFYITTMNENYTHPQLPQGAEEGIMKGIYKLENTATENAQNADKHLHLLGSGAILQEVRAAALLLKEEYQVTADVWSMTSVNCLARDGQDCDRWNMLHPENTPRVPYITEQLSTEKVPVIAATDYVRAYPEQLRAFIPQRYVALGTDGYGRSASREALRNFFEVSRYYIVVAALKALADEGHLAPKVVVEAMTKYDIDAEKDNPLYA